MRQVAGCTENNDCTCARCRPRHKPLSQRIFNQCISHINAPPNIGDTNTYRRLERAVKSGVRAKGERTFGGARLTNGRMALAKHQRFPWDLTMRGQDARRAAARVCHRIGELAAIAPWEG